MLNLLDARKLLCPLPVIRLQNKLKTLQPGDKLTVLATDPGVLYDIPAWCRLQGHTILHSKQNPKEIEITVLVGERTEAEVKKT